MIIILAARSGLVDLMMAYSKRSDLCDELVEAVHRLDRSSADQPPSAATSVKSDAPARVWRVADRLSEDRLTKLIASSQEGVTAKELAVKYSLCLTTVKGLLSKHQARRKDITPL